MLLCRTRLLPCQSDKTWAAAFLRRYRSLMPVASVKSRYALPLHKATIVLPDFIRSCSTDGGRSLTQPSPKERALKIILIET
jgi:hypothetical protein